MVEMALVYNCCIAVGFLLLGFFFFNRTSSPLMKVIKSTAKTIPITPPARKSSFSSDALCQHLEQHIQGLKEVKENAERKSLPPPHSPSSPSVEEYNAILDSYRFPPVSIPERSDHVYILGAGDKIVPVRKSSWQNIVY